MRRESRERKKREMRGDMSEGDRKKKEGEEICEGKCTAPPLLQNHD